MSDSKPKSKRIGQVWRRNDGEGMFIKLGSENQSDPKYDLTVEVTVRDSEGNVVASTTNPTMSLFEVNRNAPATLAYDISIRLPEEEGARASGSGKSSFRR